MAARSWCASWFCELDSSGWCEARSRPLAARVRECALSPAPCANRGGGGPPPVDWLRLATMVSPRSNRGHYATHGNSGPGGRPASAHSRLTHPSPAIPPRPQPILPLPSSLCQTRVAHCPREHRQIRPARAVTARSPRRRRRSRARSPRREALSRCLLARAQAEDRRCRTEAMTRTSPLASTPPASSSSPISSTTPSSRSTSPWPRASDPRRAPLHLRARHPPPSASPCSRRLSSPRQARSVPRRRRRQARRHGLRGAAVLTSPPSIFVIEVPSGLVVTLKRARLRAPQRVTTPRRGRSGSRAASTRAPPAVLRGAVRRRSADTGPWTATVSPASTWLLHTPARAGTADGSLPCARTAS